MLGRPKNTLASVVAAGRFRNGNARFAKDLTSLEGFSVDSENTPNISRYQWHSQRLHHDVLLMLQHQTSVFLIKIVMRRQEKMVFHLGNFNLVMLLANNSLLS